MRSPFTDVGRNARPPYCDQEVSTSITAIRASEGGKGQGCSGEHREDHDGAMYADGDLQNGSAHRDP